MNETETNPANDSDTETTDVVREVDIRVEKDDGDGGADNLIVIAGQDQVTYTVTVTNDGPSDATGIIVILSKCPLNLRVPGMPYQHYLLSGF